MTLTLTDPVAVLAADPDAMTPVKLGKLVVISGPSGVGKSTVVRQVIDRFGGHIRLSISATTRPPREGEQDGVDYHFLSDAEFGRRREWRKGRACQKPERSGL